MRELTMELHTEAETPLYEQIYDYIKQEIQNGKILAGEKLPSSRVLSAYLEVSRSTVDLAYGQLVSEGYICLLYTSAKSKEHYVFVIPIESELDLKKAAKAVHEKSIEMLPLKDLTELTGYVRGGCTCIGMKKQFPAVLDESAKQFPKIMVSGGRRGSQMEVSPEDLMRAANGTFADVIM